jgi:hypothetical protein
MRKFIAQQLIVVVISMLPFFSYAQSGGRFDSSATCHVNANGRNWAAPYQSLHSYATRTQTSEIVPLALHDYGGRNINSAHDTLTLKAHY